jgi:hypothetical protein
VNDDKSTGSEDLRELYGRMGQTEQEVASIASKLDQVITTLDRVVERVTAPAPRTDWVGVGSLVIAIVGAGAFYLQSRFAPVESAQEIVRQRMEAAFERELQRERDLGRLEAEVGHATRGTSGTTRKAGRD